MQRFSLLFLFNHYLTRKVQLKSADLFFKRVLAKRQMTTQSNTFHTILKRLIISFREQSRQHTKITKIRQSYEMWELNWLLQRVLACRCYILNRFIIDLFFLLCRDSSQTHWTDLLINVAVLI